MRCDVELSINRRLHFFKFILYSRNQYASTRVQKKKEKTHGQKQTLFAMTKNGSKQNDQICD